MTNISYNENVTYLLRITSLNDFQYRFESLISQPPLWLLEFRRATHALILAPGWVTGIEH